MTQDTITAAPISSPDDGASFVYPLPDSVADQAGHFTTDGGTIDLARRMGVTVLQARRDPDDLGGFLVDVPGGPAEVRHVVMMAELHDLRHDIYGIKRALEGFTTSLATSVGVSGAGLSAGLWRPPNE